MVTTNERLYTVSQAASLMGVKPTTIIRAIRAKKLKARKIGWQWVINKGDLPQRWPPERVA